MNLRKNFSLALAFALCAPAVAHAQNYLVADTPSPWVDIAMIPNVGAVQTTGLTIGGADDGGATVPIGFTFNFLGNDFTAITASTNGLFTFGNSTTGAPSGATTFFNAPIPNGAAPNNFIAAWWDDLIAPNSASFARYAVAGAAPNRIFVIQVDNLASLGGGGMMSLQLQLHEGPSRRFETRVSGTPHTAHSASAGFEGASVTAPSSSYRNCAPACSNADFTATVPVATWVSCASRV